jgi:Clp amino terminal domain, pathogenicity island component
VLTVLRDSIDEAQRLGHQWVGPEHVLLAILDHTRPSLARSVLNDVGATHRSAESHLLASLLAATPPVRSTIACRGATSPAPIFYEMQGWIAGYAAATAAPASTETALVCLCALRPDVLAGVADVRAVAAALAAKGVQVPSLLTRVSGRPLGTRRIDVPIDDLSEIRGRLVDAGLLVGFNLDAENGQAWVIVNDETLALEAINAVLHRQDRPGRGLPIDNDDHDA